MDKYREKTELLCIIVAAYNKQVILHKQDTTTYIEN